MKKIGSIARPEDILFVADVPKTRSGKIMRRLLKDIAEGKALGDTTTLADPAVVAKLKADYEEARRDVVDRTALRCNIGTGRTAALRIHIPWHSSRHTTCGRRT